MNSYHTVIVGAGQAGLAAGYYLKQAGINSAIFDSSDKIGRSWFDRYDSLRLFTFSKYNDLPGLRFPGDRNRFPTKDEVSSYLQKYAAHFQLPVNVSTRVDSVSKIEGGFIVKTSKESIVTKNVIVCTGPFQTPFIPHFSKHVNPSVLQLHSSEYKNPNQLQAGDTLVVGAGNSGVQIVEELLHASKKTYFSFSGKLKVLPNNRITQTLIFGSGLTSLSKKTFIGGMIYKRPEPIMGTNLQNLFSDKNFVKVGRTTGASHSEIIFEATKIQSIKNIIWATGFKPDFSWIDLDIFDKQGFPIHARGVSQVNGLFFLGLAWMHSRNSGLLGGVKDDAKFITNSAIARGNEIKSYAKA